MLGSISDTCITIHIMIQKNYQVIILDVSLSPIHYQYRELLIILIFLIILILATIPAVCNQVLMCVFCC